MWECLPVNRLATPTEPCEWSVSTRGDEGTRVGFTHFWFPSDACRRQWLFFPTFPHIDSLAYISQTSTCDCIVQIDISIDGSSSQKLIIIAEPYCKHLSISVAHECDHSCLFVGRHIQYSTSMSTYLMSPGTILDFSTSGSGFLDSFLLYVYIPNIISSLNSIIHSIIETHILNAVCYWHTNTSGPYTQHGSVDRIKPNGATENQP